MLRKIREKIKRNQKTFLVQVPRRGGSVLLARIEARDVADAQKTFFDNIQDFLHNPVLRQAKYIHFIDTETGEKYKVENPLYSEPEEEDSSSKKKKGRAGDIEELKEILQLEVAEKIAMNMAEGFGSAFKQMAQIMGRTTADMMQSVLESQKELLRELVRQQIGAPQQQQGTSLGEIAQFIFAMVELAKNYDKVKPLVKEFFSELKSSNPISLMQQQTSGQEVEEEVEEND